jgi:hypothetical protein
VINGQLLTFEVVSLIDGVFSMTDRETGTLWTHFDGVSLSGPLLGERLKFLPMQITTWEEWQRLYPHTTVLEWSTGFQSQYRAITPGASVGNDADFNDTRLPVNALMIGVESNGQFKSYPHQLIVRDGGIINDTLGNAPIVVFHTPVGNSGLAYSRVVAEQTLTFQVEIASLNVYIDDETGTLWNSTGLAIQGSLVDTQLEFVPSFNTEWYGWTEYHPTTAIYGSPTDWVTVTGPSTQGGFN